MIFPKIIQSPNVFVFANKASNIYEMPKQQHKKLPPDNVKKIYKKVPLNLETSIKLDAKKYCQAR